MSFSIDKAKNIHHGFSLIELLVSLSIFAIIMVASTGALLTLIDVNAKAQALYTATNNLSFALDSITREIRMGYHYYCFESTDVSTQPLPDHPDTNDWVDDGEPPQTDCTSPENAIAFNREKDDVRIGYRLTHDADDGTSFIEEKRGAKWLPVTSKDEVTVTSFSVEVENSKPYCLNSSCSETHRDEGQPTVTLKIAGYVNNGLDTNTDFNVQTRIMQRRLDLK